MRLPKVQAQARSKTDINGHTYTANEVIDACFSRILNYKWNIKDMVS